jgi:hypothetical protein
MGESSTKKSLEKTIYDNAKNHFLGNFPEFLPIEQAYIHIGIYLGWTIEKRLCSPYFEEEAETEIFRFRRRELTCAMLSEIWDGYLGYELFSEEGNLFTYYYYGGGLYKRDYESLLCQTLPSIYHVKDTWENYDLMSIRISQRHKKWKKLI